VTNCRIQTTVPPRQDDECLFSKTMHLTKLLYNPAGTSFWAVGNNRTTQGGVIAISGALFAATVGALPLHNVQHLFVLQGLQDIALATARGPKTDWTVCAVPCCRCSW
jgi:hypothetical protein